MTSFIPRKWIVMQSMRFESLNGDTESMSKTSIKPRTGASAEKACDATEAEAAASTCLTCPFTGKLKGRGLCKNCHRVAIYQINEGLITEKEAIDGGLILPGGGNGGKASPWTTKAKAYKEQKRRQKATR